ncbi:MAG: winged helix-turn-helix domain-containing protein [Syntrophobacterales bacterium]|nr:winged helix-turn-helix domain-containing protein [Syntrophobacterales bacterium]
MTAQEAAYAILKEAGRPMASREVAEIALKRGLVTSSSKDPVFSIYTTIDKNIRENRYNSPRLAFMGEGRGRTIGLPAIIDTKASQTQGTYGEKERSIKKKLSIEISEDLVDQIQIAYQARVADTFDATAIVLIQRGLASSAKEIRERLLEKLEVIDSFQSHGDGSPKLTHPSVEESVPIAGVSSGKERKTTKSRKFDEHDRNKVISAVERYFKIGLSPVGSRRKYLEDKNGKSYWILGGHENWHGIPSDMLEEEERRASNGTLIIAVVHQSRMDIFSGPLQPLITSKHTLSHTQKGDYEFHIQVRENYLVIAEFLNEGLNLSLEKIGVVPVDKEC